MTELQAFVAMLARAGVGHGTRVDHNPAGTAVLVEHDDDGRFMLTDWKFDGAGRLLDIQLYEGD